MESLLQGAQTLELFRNEPSRLIHVLGAWWQDAVESYYQVEGGMLPRPSRGFFLDTRRLVLWCDAELRTLDAAPLQQISDQIWARVVKAHCLISCGGTYINGTCDRCGSTDARDPNWATPDEMKRTLGRAQAVKERIEALASTAAKVKWNQDHKQQSAPANGNRNGVTYDAQSLPAEYRESGKPDGEPLVVPYLADNTDWLLTANVLAGARRNGKVKSVKVQIDGKTKDAHEFTSLAAFRLEKTRREDN
jgi:hypothetical protein